MKKNKTLNNENDYSWLKLIRRTLEVLMKDNKRLLLSIIIINIIIGISGVVVTLSMQSVINNLQQNMNNMSRAMIPLVIYSGMFMIKVICRDLYGYTYQKFTLKLDYKLSNLILDKTSRLELSDFEKSENYDKLSRAKEQGNENFISVFRVAQNIILNSIEFISYSAMIITWNPAVYLSICLLPVISVSYNLYLTELKYKIQKKRSPMKRKKAYYLDLLTNDNSFKEIKFYSLNSFFIDKFNRISREFIDFDTIFMKKQAKIMMIFSFLETAISCAISFIIVKAAFVGEILLGNTITYMRCITSIQYAANEILSSINTAYHDKLYLIQFFEFLDIKERREEFEEKIDIKSIDSIEFKNVSFKYPNRGEYALENISFRINKGENISIVGSNGSGKTTMIKLICGVYRNYEGQILINDVNIKKINQKEYIEKLGVIFQDFNKYEVSCKENIVLDCKDELSSGFRLKEAIKVSKVNNVIKRLPEKILSQLGVRFSGGVQLSGGEWQKIALARAFFRNSEVYILDEPSSALDPISEHEIFQSVGNVTKSKIGVLVTHRLINTAKFSSRILVLENGKLMEDDTYDNLMRKKTLFKEMYKLQGGELKAS